MANGHNYGNGSGAYYRENGFGEWIRKNALTLAVLLAGITSSFFLLRSEVRSVREAMAVQSEAVSDLRGEIGEIKGNLSALREYKYKMESLTDRVNRIEDLQTIQQLQSGNLRETLLSKGVITKKDLRTRGD